MASAERTEGFVAPLDPANGANGEAAHYLVEGVCGEADCVCFKLTKIRHETRSKEDTEQKGCMDPAE